MTCLRLQDSSPSLGSGSLSLTQGSPESSWYMEQLWAVVFVRPVAFSRHGEWLGFWREAVGCCGCREQIAPCLPLPRPLATLRAASHPDQPCSGTRRSWPDAHSHCLPVRSLYTLAKVWLTSHKPRESKLHTAAAPPPPLLGITSLLVYSFISFHQICFGSVHALPELPI